MKKKEIISCAKKCMDDELLCPCTDCRHWISYENDNNCSLVSIYVNGKMSLHQVAERLDLSFVRISQIEKAALKKLKNRPNLLNLLEN